MNALKVDGKRSSVFNAPGQSSRPIHMMRASAILALLMYALIGIDGTTVLCFGLDGHIAYESTAVGHLPAGIAQATESGDLTSVGAQHKSSHGPCVDPVMTGAQWKAPAEGDFFDHQLARVTSPAVGSAGVPLVACGHPGRRGFLSATEFRAPSVDALSTTVLRI